MGEVEQLIGEGQELSEESQQRRGEEAEIKEGRR